EDMDISSILPIWNSVYNSVSIMANHATPYHRDVSGWQQWLDMLPEQSSLCQGPCWNIGWVMEMAITHALHTTCGKMYITQLEFHYAIHCICPTYNGSTSQFTCK
ncbi:hypothetical protein EDC04DRAFT_2576045, partial [Pisolithus marmoratus]